MYIEHLFDIGNISGLFFDIRVRWWQIFKRRSTFIRNRSFLHFLVYLAIFAGFIYGYHNSPTFQNNVNNVATVAMAKVNQLTSQWGLGSANTSSTPTKNTHQQVSQTKNKVNGEGRWPKRTATVYVSISNPTLHQAAETAIKQWNDTGAFTFKQVNDKSKADVYFHTNDDPTNGSAGLTTMESNAMTGYFVHADVTINAGYLLDPDYGYGTDRIVNTAEHELGHAIGLNHTNDVSVMQPAGSMCPIQQEDVDHVNQLYNEKPSGSGKQTISEPPTKSGNNQNNDNQNNQQ